MPYVQRDALGKVTGMFANLQPGYADELLSDEHPEVVAYLAPKLPIDLSDIDNLERTLKALALVLRDYTNALQAGTHTQKTVAQLKADFAAKYQGLAP